MFGDYDSKKVMFVLIAVGLICLIFSGLMGGANTNFIIAKLLIMPGLVLGLSIHEFSHAKMADKLGDPTPESQGRLTLNPLAHLDPVGTICLFFAGFGWGKPVQIDSSYFRNPAKDNMLVALAGPVSNIILAFIFFLIHGILYFFVPIDTTFGELFVDMFYYGAFINLSLGVFNLLPFPPLDGSKILSYFLKGKARGFIWSLEKYSWIILMILFITNIPQLLITPIVDWLANAMYWVVLQIMVLFI